MVILIAFQIWLRWQKELLHLNFYKSRSTKCFFHLTIWKKIELKFCNLTGQNSPTSHDEIVRAAYEG